MSASIADLKSQIPNGRLPVATVRRIERLVGGDVAVEELVLRVIAKRYGARNLLYLPGNVAAAIVDRPGKFLEMVRGYFDPELRF